MSDYFNLDSLDSYLQESLSRYEDFFQEIIFNETGCKFEDITESHDYKIHFDSDNKIIIDDVKQTAAIGMLYIEVIKKEKDIVRLLKYLEHISICFGYIKSINLSETIYSDYSDISFSEYMSKNGFKGATKRHAPMGKLKAFSINLAKEYPLNNSANKIAFEIKNTVYEHGRTINANLSQHNAQDTIKKWINESRNKKTGG